MADAWKAEHFGGPEGEEVEVEEDEVEREFWRVISGAGAGPGGGSGGGGESRFRAPREVRLIA